jgi:hypothetical protein
MAQIFNRNANRLPFLSLGGVGLLGLLVIGTVWYYGSPAFYDVGYRPVQPVPFSHLQHAGQLGINCQYCHVGVEDSKHAIVPATQVCMNCHNQIQPQSLRLLPVRESWATGVPVPWVKVHHMPDFAVFPHNIHVDVGIGCETCHGRIDQMVVVQQVEELSMAWCLDCHRNPEQYLRSTELVTVMGLDAQMRADDAAMRNHVRQNLARISAEGINPPQNCSACHY